MQYSNNILPLITKPTRITDDTATLIDHIYTNSSPKNLISKIVDIYIVDLKKI